MNAQVQPKDRAQTKSRALIVDDDASILGIVSEVLSDDGYDVSTAGSGEEAIELLEHETFALVMSDIRLPGINGIGVLEHVKSTSPRTNVIMITSHGSMETSIGALKLGAYDYLLKPFDDLAMISNAAKRAVDAYNLDVERSQLIKSLELSNEKLARVNRILHGLAIRDGLTNLFNHRHINEILDKAIVKALTDGTDLSLIFLDVDKFKVFNDVHGHHSGDKLLRELGKLMRENVRSQDLAARWGGEEFVIVSPRTDETTAARVAEALRAKIAEHPFAAAEGQPHERVTISAGVASLQKQKSKAAVIEAADEALYEAKNSGRNRVCIAGLKNTKTASP